MAEEVLPGYVDEERERITYPLAAWRARQALEQAPELVAHVRSMIIRGEAGDRGAVDVDDGTGGRVQLLGLREDSSPLCVTAADDSDELYAELVEWVVYWAGKLEGELPPATAVAWRIRHGGEAYGFHAGTTVEGAALLARVQTMWLLLRHDQITAHPEGPGYVKYITDQVWALRARYPMREQRRRETPVAICEHCKFKEMRVSWFHGEDRDLVAVKCGYCGHEPGGRGLNRERRKAEVLRWLNQQNLLDPRTARVP